MRAPAWIAFLVVTAGCAEAPSSVAIPPVELGTRRAIPWQQFCEQAVSVPQASALAAARGAEGWELVAMYNGVLCYKRPAPIRVNPVPGARPPSSATDPGIHIIPDPGF